MVLIEELLDRPPVASSLNQPGPKGQVITHCMNTTERPLTFRSGATIGSYTAVEALLVEEDDPLLVDAGPTSINGVVAYLEELFQKGPQRVNILVHLKRELGQSDNPSQTQTREGGRGREAGIGSAQTRAHQAHRRSLELPVVLVRKRHWKWRFCIDYWHINAVTEQDAYPLPRIDDNLDALSGSCYFSTLDLVSGYWQVLLDAEAQEESAFSTRTLLLYLDVIIVIAPHFGTHLHRLEEVFQRLHKSGLKLKPSKCELLQFQFHYLGHIVSQDGVFTDHKKVKAVAKWPSPRVVRELHEILGMGGYYRQYILEFDAIAHPLHRLTAKEEFWRYMERKHATYNMLNESISTAPILGYPDPRRQYILDTDASGCGVKAVLYQAQEGCERSWIDQGQCRIPKGLAGNPHGTPTPTVAELNLDAEGFPEGLTAQPEVTGSKSKLARTQATGQGQGRHVPCHRRWRGVASSTTRGREQRAGHLALNAGLSAHTTGWRAGSTRGPAGPRQIVGHLFPRQAGNHDVANACPGSVWGGKDYRSLPTDVVLARTDVHSQTANQELRGVPGNKAWRDKSGKSKRRLYAGLPWQNLAVNLVRSFFVTPRENKWVLVLTNQITRWQDGLALPDATAPVVGNALDERVFCHLGLPEQIHTDYGAQFESQLMTKLCQLWNMEKAHTTLYHPLANGTVVRNNRGLRDSLRVLLLARGHDQWDLLLPQLMRVYKSTTPLPRLEKQPTC
ncbi:uncharacterized protein [Watersipora subatra]|uniref:uncharacterized protein n=1 Tax=Watersipora subatra TaxID=2589382 RepID=UPI00355C23D9